MQKLKDIYGRVPVFLKNLYALAVYVFLFWMVFFDNYNVFFRLKLAGQLHQAHQQETYYTQQIKQVKSDLNELFSTNEALEKFDREKYYMKRDDEDVFVIVHK